METDIYRAPESELQNTEQAAGRGFYVVSKTKFLVLFFATFGFYELPVGFPV